MNRRKLLFAACLPAVLLLCTSWGFFAHRRICRMAVFTLPSEMLGFYRNNIHFLTEHSVDPDKKRYADPGEGGRHFLDSERYGSCPFDSIPERWADAVAKYSADTLNMYGTVPWQIERTYYALVKAFQTRDSLRILRLSAHLSHYIADAHVPLHVTWNYNGQLTGQTGIHAFWESRLPELFASQYDFFTGKAQYIDSPLKEAWRIVRSTHTYKDSVFIIEARLNSSFLTDKKYSYEERNGRVIKQYSSAYSTAYHEALNGMVEKQMRSSIAATGNYWYSAWVDAGQPDLRNMKQKQQFTPDDDKEHGQKENRLFKKGRILGRPDL